MSGMPRFVPHQYSTLIMLSLMACISYSQTPQNAPSPSVTITIFIHGTIKPKLALYSIINVMRDRLDNSQYRHALYFLRQDPCLYQTHAIQRVGLQPIDQASTDTIGARVLAELYDAIFALYKEAHEKNIYYTFGWSGLLSTVHRYEDAKKLYKQLLKLIKQYRTQGIHPRIRIIAYSHGGNVALNLALVREHLHVDPLFFIDELILLGTPIIQDTEAFINDALFKKIYHFYSPGDRAQTKDYVSARSRAHRCFHTRANRPLPAKLTQIKLRIASNSIAKYPVARKKRPRIIATAPGHIELWFFGWTPEWYRTSFPLYPLPTVAFCSYMIDHLTRAPLSCNHIELTVYPDAEKMVVRPLRPQPSRHLYTLPFIPQLQLSLLKEQAARFKPSANLKEQIEIGLDKAIKKARHFKRMYKHAKHKVRRRLRRNKSILATELLSTPSTLPENQTYAAAAPSATASAHQVLPAVDAFALNYFSMYDEDMQKRT